MSWNNVSKYYVSSVNRLDEIYCQESTAGDLDKLLFAVENYNVATTDYFEDAIVNKNLTDRAMDDE